VKAGEEGTLKNVGKNQRPLTVVKMELARVKLELVQVKMERDILKNCPKSVATFPCDVRNAIGYT
jgi:hypothetical protein